VTHYKEADGNECSTSRKYMRKMHRMNLKAKKAKKKPVLLDKNVCMACGLRPENPAVLIP
jgi:hypothetical protein